MEFQQGYRANATWGRTAESGQEKMAIRVFLANSRVILLDSLQVLLELQQDMKIVGKATNGHDAVRRIQKLRPDVAILDIGLVSLNGMEASLKISELSKSTAIVILSTFAVDLDSSLILRLASIPLRLT